MEDPKGVPGNAESTWQATSPVAQLALSASSKFKEDYVELSRSLFHNTDANNRLHHAGEFGRYREQLLKSFLGAFLPNRLAIGDGFIATPRGALSSQCDVVLYERDATPHLAAAGGRAIFPIEVCAAVGEAKSILNFSELKTALKKLRTTKQMRAEMEVLTFPIAPVEAVVGAGHYLHKQAELGFLNHLDEAARLYLPAKKEEQNLVTFIVCEEIKWPANCDPADPNGAGFRNALNSLYDESSDYHLQHNFILSLKQGFLSYSFIYPEYSQTRHISYPYPVQSRYRSPYVTDDTPARCGWRWLRAGEKNHHIMTFSAELIHAAGQVPIYAFDPKNHTLDPEGYDFTFIPVT